MEKQKLEIVKYHFFNNRVKFCLGQMTPVFKNY